MMDLAIVLKRKNSAVLASLHELTHADVSKNKRIERFSTPHQLLFRLLGMRSLCVGA
jgi:hypothetical protein